MTEAEETTPPTDCCVVDSRIARHFDGRFIDLSTEKLPEMVAVSRRLLALLDDVANRRPTVLELGCGSAALSVALLERGAASVDGVDLSPKSLAAARRRADEAGVGERASFEVGDGAQVPLKAHDWVVLDRVMCCYPNLEALLGSAVSAAGDRFAFSVPTSWGWRGAITRLIVTAENKTNRFRGRPCPGYVHDVQRIESALRDAGFERHSESRGFWYAAVWDRSPA